MCTGLGHFQSKYQGSSWDTCETHAPSASQCHFVRQLSNSLASLESKQNKHSKQKTWHISCHLGQWTLTHVCKNCDTCLAKSTWTHAWTCPPRLLQLRQMQRLSAQDEFKKTETSKRIRADSRHHDKCFSSPSFLQSSYWHSCRSSCHLPHHPCSGKASGTWVYTWKHFCRDIKQFQL